MTDGVRGKWDLGCVCVCAGEGRGGGGGGGVKLTPQKILPPKSQKVQPY